MTVHGSRYEEQMLNQLMTLNKYMESLEEARKRTRDEMEVMPVLHTF